MSERTVKGKNVIVTGGGKNLGSAIAFDLASHGVRGIVIHYNSDASKDEAERTVLALGQLGVISEALQADLRTASAAKKLFEDSKRILGSIDIAVNTVGMVLKKPLLEISEEEYDSMFAINSKCSFFFIKEAGVHLSNGGCIITIVTSLLGAFTPFYASYAGSKAPVEHFTRAASKELGARGISVTALGPGPMDTAFFYGQETPEAVVYHKNAPALAKFTKTGLTDVEDIAPWIRFLATDGWWMTGQTILVNGGYTTK